MDMKKYRNSLSARRLALGISALLCTVTGILLLAVSSGLSDSLLHQQMAKRWSEEKDAAQISCFFSPNAGVDTDRIQSFRYELDKALTEASILQDSPNAGARLWADAYSAKGKITLSTERGKITADCIGVGGDFFLFHPLEFLHGTYFTEEYLNQDYCVIDEDAAWQLFGSNDVEGMTVMIGQIPHIVSGVIRREDGRMYQAAGLKSSVVYVPYSVLETHGVNYGIGHYEIVMPNPVSGYAFQYVKEHIGIVENEFEIVENSTRYQPGKRLEVLKKFATRSMTSKAVIYPYWENVARGYEDVIALLTFISILLFLYPGSFAVIAAYLYRKQWLQAAGKGLRAIPGLAGKLLESYRLGKIKGKYSRKRYGKRRR